MLLKFRLNNYKVFKDEIDFSLIASSYDKDVRERENVVSLQDHKLRILKSAVVYGANASGKSKLIEAFGFMRHFAINSAKGSQSGDRIDVEPFRLNSESENGNTEFEVTFVKNNELFRYGFEINSQQVLSEWLYNKPNTKEIELFYRDKQDISVHPLKLRSVKMLVREKLVRDNSLLLSVAAQFNVDVAKTVLDWFKGFRTLSGLNEDGYHGFTMSRTMDQNIKGKILELVKAADLGISDIAIQKLDLDNLPSEMPSQYKELIRKKIIEEDAEFLSDVQTTHKKYDADSKFIGNEVFSMENDESSGTKKFFALTGPILDALENGYILAIDELDSKLHPNLTCKIVSMFNSEELNPKNAQLIFNTHNTNLLDSGLFRRDQIWFTEKNDFGEARLFSLGDFKSVDVRKDENYEINYLRGKYGGIPYLDFFNELFDNKRRLEYEGK